MHQFTINESHSYDAREVADLVKSVYLRGQESTAMAAAEEIVEATAKAEAKAKLTCYRWFVAGCVAGSGSVLLYQVIA